MDAESNTNYDNGRASCENRSSIREVPQEREDEQMKDVIESRFEFDKAIGAGLAKEINALYNDGGHGRLTLPIGVCSAPSCWSPWAVSADRRHLQDVERLEAGEDSCGRSTHWQGGVLRVRAIGIRDDSRQRDPHRGGRVLALPPAERRASPARRDKRWRPGIFRVRDFRWRGVWETVRLDGWRSSCW